MVMSCIENDLNALFASSDFGEANDVIRGNKNTDPIAGIFDDEDIEVLNGEGVAVLMAQASFECASSKVPDLVVDEIFTIRNIGYKVKYWKDDGTGAVTIYFERPDK